MPQDDNLLQIIRGRHTHAALLAQLVGGALDVGVGGLRLLGVDHADAADRLHRAGVALDLVGVEHQNDHALAIALIVGENVDQRRARGGNVLLRQRLELVPGKDHVVPVHEQILRPLLLERHVVLFAVQRGTCRRFDRLKRAVFYLAVGALKDALQLLVLGKADAAVRPADRGGHLGRFLRLRGKTAAQMHARRRLVPGDGDAAAMVTEDGRGGILHVAVGIVADFFGHALGVVAGFVAAHGAAQPPAPAGIGGDLLPVVPQSRHRGKACEHGVIVLSLRRVHAAAHALQVGHRPAHALGRQLQPEVVIGFQQDRLGLHQPLTDRAIGRLPEVAALGVLEVGAPGEQGEANVGDG